VKNLSNFWSGSWRSRYTLSVSGGKPSLQGTVKITTHYFGQQNYHESTLNITYYCSFMQRTVIHRYLERA
jgi:hypothetical protein